MYGEVNNLTVSNWVREIGQNNLVSVILQFSEVFFHKICYLVLTLVPKIELGVFRMYCHLSTIFLYKD